MRNLAKTFVGAAVAGAMALTSAAPAMAQSRYERHDRDEVSTGDVIAGALIVGGIAALASSGRDNYRGRGYDRAGSPRSAVEQCVYAAERSAGRHSYRGNAKVTDIRDIDAKRDGWRVKGRIAVNTLGRNWRNGDRQYGNGWGGDYRGWNNRYRGYDAGSFTCDVRYGRVVDVDIHGIRGVR